MENKKRIIEVCCCSMSDVIAARDGGANRVELCSASFAGGLTPSAGLIVGAVRERGEMAVNVLIRPREGDFVYTTRELAVMESDIEAAKAAGVQGVVIGALNADGTLDSEAMKRLMKHTGGLNVTFHRAIDECTAPEDAIERLIGMGVDHVLTSGGEKTASEGAERIARWIERFGNRITIMPGSGITAGNISEIERVTGAKEFHGTFSSCPQETPSRLFGPKPKSVDLGKVLELFSSH